MPLSHVFGPEEEWPAQDLIAFSDDLDAGLTLEAYRAGVFPMPLHRGAFPGVIGWWSPRHRGIVLPGGLRVTRSLRQSVRRYRLTADMAFDEVLQRCGDPLRPDGWIDAGIRAVYTQLHETGYVHSVEAWTPQGDLAGGLYGVSLGGLFAGESMFHDAQVGRDASKVALTGLVQLLTASAHPARLIDVQWATPHLRSLGAQEVPRTDYLRRLDAALDVPAVEWPKGALHA